MHVVFLQLWNSYKQRWWKAELVCPPPSIFARSSGKRCARALTQRGQSLTRALQVHARDAVYLSVITVLRSWDSSRGNLPQNTQISAVLGYRGPDFTDFPTCSALRVTRVCSTLAAFPVDTANEMYEKCEEESAAQGPWNTHTFARDAFTCCLMSYERVPGGTWTCRSVHERFSRRYNVAIIRSCVETNNLFSCLIAETVKVIYSADFWRLRSDKCTSFFFCLHSYLPVFKICEYNNLHCYIIMHYYSLNNNFEAVL